mmetsp:Transcript_34349/g.65617  ORF Transcript_34349/g.65617 Transcript_34349/m.65617 type:complete len:210 (-) Transcript_34349:3412-4041(-)
MLAAVVFLLFLPHVRAGGELDCLEDGHARREGAVVQAELQARRRGGRSSRRRRRRGLLSSPVRRRRALEVLRCSSRHRRSDAPSSSRLRRGCLGRVRKARRRGSAARLPGNTSGGVAPVAQEHLLHALAVSRRAVLLLLFLLLLHLLVVVQTLHAFEGEVVFVVVCVVLLALLHGVRGRQLQLRGERASAARGGGVAVRARRLARLERA